MRTHTLTLFETLNQEDELRASGLRAASFSGETRPVVLTANVATTISCSNSFRRGGRCFTAGNEAAAKFRLP
jgi:hypothetical protein